MPFEKGHKKSIGYSAAKRALADKFVRGLMYDFQDHGDKIIEKVREKSPDVYLRLCAQLIPQTLEIETAEPMSLEAAMGECVQFLLNLPDNEYNIVMQAVQAERLQTIPETPAIEHDAVH